MSYRTILAIGAALLAILLVYAGYRGLTTTTATHNPPVASFFIDAERAAALAGHADRIAL